MQCGCVTWLAVRSCDVMRMCMYDVVNSEVMCCHDTATKILRQPRKITFQLPKYCAFHGK